MDVVRAGVGDGIASCMGCHGNPEMTLPLPSGEELRLFVDKTRFVGSAHGKRLACVDCHTSLGGGVVPHPTRHYANRRAYTTMLYEACKRCHFDNYTRTLDSVHFKALRSGKAGAPVCSDCHSAHYVHKPAVSRGRDSAACGKCHEEIYKRYASSVHGQALLSANNHDVPSCTTCHGVHNIGEASSNGFRLVSTELCARCHADAKLMEKYGLPSNVLKTYLEDFHGRTVRFKQQEGEAKDLKEPLCIDCHGIHDIKSVKDPSSPVVKANLQKTCQKCHSDASTYFPSAWTGHYEPSMSRAPLVFLIRWTYIILIPLLVGGLLLHIGLDVWRLVKNR